MNEIELLKFKNKQLINLLSMFQWSWRKHGDANHYCPYCDNPDYEGHTENCLIDKHITGN